ncbi:MAG: TRAP transporter large permease [Gaiellales bacterium]
MTDVPTAAVFVVLVVLLVLGVRVFYALLAAGLVGTTYVLEPSQPVEVMSSAWQQTNSYSLTAIPLFLLMAQVLVRSSIAEDAYASINWLLRRVPGGAAYGNVIGSTVFAALSGSSVANAAALGSIAGPTMVKMGYSQRLTYGTIAAGGTLGILMPPSSALIIYGGLTGESISELFIAGVLPALLVMTLFCLTILLWTLRSPSIVPDQRSQALIQDVGWVHVLRGLVAPTLLVAGILGGIYAGAFTATEAGAAGVVGALILAGARRQLSVRSLIESGGATVQMTSVVVMIIAGAAALTYVMGILGLPSELAITVLGWDLPTTAVLLAIAGVYFLLGLFIESVSILILTIPVVFPVLEALGVDPVWAGIYIVLLIEIGLITPPVGLNIYVLQEIAGPNSFREIVIGAQPFVVSLAVAVGILIFAPEVATWLPSRM